MEVLYFSDRDVKRKLFDRVANAARPLIVVQVRQDRHARPPEEREPFVTIDRRFGDVVDLVVVADEGTNEGMWRDPMGDLAEHLYPNDKQAAYAAASGYLLLEDGRPLTVVKRHGAAADDLWFLQQVLAAQVDGVPPPDPAKRPGKQPQPAAAPPPRASPPRDPPGWRPRVDPSGWRSRHRAPRREREFEPEPPSEPRAPPPDEPVLEDPWKVLGIAPGTPLPEAKKAYRALVVQYHPDKVSHLGPEFRELAEARTRKILDAWRRIEDREDG